MSIDYDKYGHCSLCHKIMMKHIVSDGKLVQVFTAEATHMEKTLTDGSKMRVAVCKTCKNDYKPETDDKRLMASVIKGWGKEADELVADITKPQFDEVWKAEYMDKYSKKEIANGPHR